MKTTLIMSLMLAAIPAAADHHEKKEKGPCRGDIERFCAEVEPGGGRIVECLQRHESELSQSCRESKRMMRADMKDKMIDACRADASSLCPGKEVGTGLLVCLKENKEKLSAGCKESMRDFKEMRREHRKETKSKKKGEGKHKP